MTIRLQDVLCAGSLALSTTMLLACDDPDTFKTDDQAEIDDDSAPTSREANVALMPAPVGFWHLDENCSTTVVTDDSGHAAHGQRIGGTGCVAGKTDLAAAFDGVDDRIEIPDRPAFHFSTQMTAAAWVKPTSTNGLRTIVNKWYTMDSYALYIADGKYNFGIALPNGGWGTTHDVSAPAVPGVWAHVAGVYDGKSISLYINGVLAATKTISSQPQALQDSTRPIVIGNHPSWNAFAGQIDEVRLYDVSLSATQVKSLTRNEYYVATTGSDSNPGTRAKPFKTLAKGGWIAQAGDTVQVRGGVYNVNTAGEPLVVLKNIGTAAEPIVFREYLGEEVILDGLQGAEERSLIVVNGQHYDIIGLELANAKWSAISMWDEHGIGGQHIRILGNEIHHSRKGAVYPDPDSRFMHFEGNDIHHNIMENADKTLYCHNGRWASSVNMTDEGDVVVGNTIHENWGEGIGAYGKGHRVADNVLHDNYSVDIYVNNIFDSVIERNFVYTNNIETFYRAYYPDGASCPLADDEACKCSLLNKVEAAAVGIALANEEPADPRLANNRVVNNIVVGERRSGIQLTSWSSNTDPKTGSGPSDMQNSVIAHNTVVCDAESGVFRISGDSPVSDDLKGMVKNNIFYQRNTQYRVAKLSHAVDIVFAGNNWFGGNGVAFPLATSPTDVLTDPLLVKAQGSELPVPFDYMLTAASPDINAGQAIAGAPLTQDYFGGPRPIGPAADIGAHELAP